MNPYYTDYASYLATLFPGIKVQKISVNAGLSCPNRDGTIGFGGCSYCDNTTFSPLYCMEGSGVAAQIEFGKRFFARKYPQMKYLAYFQSFTNTHGRTPAQLRALYEEALKADGLVGLVVGTRPDTVSEEVADILADLQRTTTVMVELGAESSRDDTLRRVNRGHTWADTSHTASLLAGRGIHVGLHLIAGMPGEDAGDFLQSVEDACRLPVDSLKFHQLQVIKGTPLHSQWLAGKADIAEWSAIEYMEICARALQIVPRAIAIERFLAQAPPEKVATPNWGLKNHEFVNMLHNHLKNKPTSYHTQKK